MAKRPPKPAGIEPALRFKRRRSSAAKTEGAQTRPDPFRYHAEYAIALELLCTNWATLEWSLAVAIWACFGMPQPYATKITDNLDITARARLLLAVSDVKFTADEERDIIKATHDAIQQLATERNLIVHGRRHLTRSGYVYFDVDRGKYAGIPQKRTPEQISAIAVDICDVGNTFVSLLYNHDLMESGAAELMSLFLENDEA